MTDKAAAGVQPPKDTSRPVSSPHGPLQPQESAFLPGQRVMITEWGTDPVCGELTGYYGHVWHVTRVLAPRYWVTVEGRVGGRAHPQIVGWAWPFGANELEHAD